MTGQEPVLVDLLTANQPPKEWDVTVPKTNIFVSIPTKNGHTENEPDYFGNFSMTRFSSTVTTLRWERKAESD